MTTRRQQARLLREAAAEQAFNRDHPTHIANGDERSSWRYGMSFTKGLEHEEATGLVAKNNDFNQFVRGIDSGDPRDFVDTPAGIKGKDWRAWESEGAGLIYDLQGPDAQAVHMPPAPKAGSAELTAEVAEVYAQAILRDCPLSELQHGADDELVGGVIDDLNKLDWFNGVADVVDSTGRRRTDLNRQTAFRGLAPGDTVGPYLSQFMLVGTGGLGASRLSRTGGQVQYGAQTISQKVRKATPGKDYMQTWNDWLCVQNGLDERGKETYLDEFRFITTGRDLATYVHYDALYQAYLTACVMMLGEGYAFDPGVPFQLDDDIDHQQGFAHFGGPHILTLVTEVATRALKAVRYQKFNVHRRARPEVMAGRYEKAHEADVARIPGIVDGRIAIGGSGITDRIEAMNEDEDGNTNLLLPMAFPEGSPMHPSYGAGHATVAGACVTILKAFFDHSQPVTFDTDPDKGYVVGHDGELKLVDVVDANGNHAELTVEGELNKLASNISIGRDWAGVHYYSDYWESLKMGEQIAIAMLEEHKLCFNENFSMTVPLFEGGTRRI